MNLTEGAKKVAYLLAYGLSSYVSSYSPTSSERRYQIFCTVRPVRAGAAVLSENVDAAGR